MHASREDIKKLTLALLKDLRDHGHEPSIGLAIGLQMVLLYGRVVVVQTQGNSAAMAEFNDHLRGCVEEIIEDMFRYRNERFPLEG